MELNKKAFIRSIEAVIAILLFLSFYNFATQNLKTQIPRADPTFSVFELLNSMDDTSVLNSFLNTYSLRELTNSLKHLLPPTMGFKLEVDYYEPVIIENLNNYAVNYNLSFTRFFPETVNINSVLLFDNEGKSLPTQIVNNYYKTIISVQNNDELFNKTITLANIRVKTSNDEQINTTSFTAFIKSDKVLLSLDSINYNTEYSDANATITLLVPFAEKNEVFIITLFYAGGEGDEVITYPSLVQGYELLYSSSEPVKSKASSVRFSSELNANEQKRITLYYELNTDSARVFDELTPNSENIKIISRSFYHESTLPLTSYQAPSTFNVRRSVFTDELNCMINLKVWNYE